MDIYLDTSHLQKWQQRTLPRDDLIILNKLKNSGDHSFIISLAHIFDITDREDTHKAIEMGRFLDQLPKKWIRNAVDLKREEIKNALTCYRYDQKSQAHPFVDDYVDTLEAEINTLPIRLIFRGTSIEKIITALTNEGPQKPIPSLTKENLYSWSHIHSIALKKMPNTENKNKEMQKNLRRVLRDDIAKFKLQESITQIVTSDTKTIADPINEFISWLIKNPSLIPSIWCPYYTQHYMLRATGMKWKKSHIDDLTHLSAIPYVDYLSTDNQLYAFAMQALKFAKRHIPVDWEKKLITHINEINDSKGFRPCRVSKQ